MLDQRVVDLQLDGLQPLLAHALAIHGLEQVGQPVEDVVLKDDALDGEARRLLGQGGQRYRLSGCGRGEDVRTGIGAVAGLVELLLLQALDVGARGDARWGDLGEGERTGRAGTKGGCT